MLEIFFDGICWVARRAGCPGRVFGSTPEEALSRAKEWAWKHLTKAELSRKRAAL